MVTRANGEVDVVLGKTRYKLKLGHAAVMATQEILITNGRVPSIEELMDGVNKQRLKYIIAFIWGSMQKHHPDMTMDRVTDLMDVCTMAEVLPVAQALGLSLVPDQADLEELGVQPPNPPKAQTRRSRGTGGSSSSKRGQSV